MTQPILTDIPMESFLSHIDAVAGAIARSDWRPDYIVGVGRGGLVPATYLSHAISQPMLSVDLSAQVVGFCDELLDKLVAMALEGSRLLFVDDINDSGRTINQLRAALAGAPADHLRFAVLIDNVSSAAKVEYRATTIDRIVTKDWFVFPWEAVASRASILSDWGEVPERTS